MHNWIIIKSDNKKVLNGVIIKRTFKLKIKLWGLSVNIMVYWSQKDHWTFPLNFKNTFSMKIREFFAQRVRGGIKLRFLSNTQYLRFVYAATYPFIFTTSNCQILNNLEKIKSASIWFEVQTSRFRKFGIIWHCYNQGI